MNCRFGLGLLALLVSVGALSAEPTAEQLKAKEMLQSLNEFIGEWNGNGAPEGGKGGLWKEKMTLGWKFSKEGETFLTATFDKSTLYDKGELRFDTKKKMYQFQVATKDGKKLLFEGEFKKGILEMYAVDSTTKDKTRLSLSTNNDGARLVYNVAVQPKSKGLFKKAYQVQHTREGESIAAGKKQECIVTGGLGTMPVSFGGKTYYVCCGGCRDAFNEDPAKFVREFEAKQKKK